MKPYDYKRELVMLRCEQHSDKIPEIIKALRKAKKVFIKLQKRYLGLENAT
jgi:lipase chaperone LimK